jgi:hypothetical protein
MLLVFSVGLGRRGDGDMPYTKNMSKDMFLVLKVGGAG